MRYLLAAVLTCIAMPAAAQVTASLPVTCNASGSNCTQAQPVTNPDGSTVGAAIPSSSATNGIAPSANTVVGGSRILKASAGNLYSVNVVSGASAGFVLIFDSATVPADGTVTPVKCMPLAANTGIDLNFRSLPLAMTNGAVVVFSTSGCYSKTLSTTAFISGDVK